MTIGEKASEYAEKHFPSDHISNSGKHDVAFHSHIAGAEWMIVKATSWLVKQGLKTNDGVVTICVEDFIKAMEE